MSGAYASECRSHRTGEGREEREREGEKETRSSVPSRNSRRPYDEARRRPLHTIKTPAVVTGDDGDDDDDDVHDLLVGLLPVLQHQPHVRLNVIFVREIFRRGAQYSRY